jgi:glycosyltransferase involved in cell wall biosynthesis
MERFADELEWALGQVTHAQVVRLPEIGDEVSRRTRKRVSRFVVYPWQARRIRTDLFHVVDQGYGDLAAVLPRDRVVVTCHDLMLLRAAAGRKTGFRPPQLATRRFRYSTSFLKRVARIVCPSTATKHDVVDLLEIVPERVCVVPNGIHPRFHRFGEEERMRMRSLVRESPDERIVLSVSTGNRYKNIAGVLNVLSELKRSGTQFRLVRVGRKLNEAEQRLARSLGIEDAIDDKGRVSDDELVRLYNAVDLLLFPSFWEGFGWPVLEAMACGLPIVSSSADALRELARDCALYADAEDVDGLASAVLTITGSDHVERSLSSAGMARAALFSWERSAAAYARVYEEVAEAAT